MSQASKEELEKALEMAIDALSTIYLNCTTIEAADEIVEEILPELEAVLKPPANAPKALRHP